jgi:hypothetical protein
MNRFATLDVRVTALLALAAYLAFDLLLPRIPLPRHLSPLTAACLVFASTAPFMLLQLWLAHAVVNLKTRPLVNAALMLLCGAVWVAVLFYVRPHLHWSYGLNETVFIVRPILQGLTITLGCAFFGILLAPIIREPNVLLPVALVAMPIDYLGAMTPIGFTQNALANNPHLVQALSVPVPTAGSGAHHHGALHAIAFIGPGDALFMAFFFAVVLRLKLNTRGTFWGMYGLLTATMLLVLFTGLSVAALIPMGLAVVIANHNYFRLKREEVFATLYAAGLILVLVTGFYFYSHSHFFTSHSQGDAYAPRNPGRNAPGRPAGN